MRMRLLGAAAVLLAGTAVAPAQAHFLSCHSVDSGEIRYGGSTTYSDAFNNATSVWNNLGSIYIGPDTWTTYEDVTWGDANRSDVSWAGIYSCTSWGTDSIQTNIHYMSGYTTAQRRNVAAHETGHALGLGHSYSGQLLYAYVTSITSPQSHDISDYRSLWG